MKRRRFLKGAMALPVMGTGMLMRSPLEMGTANAMSGSNKTLVVVFQKGGNDGLNTVVPFAEGRYYDLRRDIAVRPPGKGGASALNLDGFFGFHPAMSPLLPYYQGGDLAIMPSVQYPNASRSHFAGQQLVQSGTTSKSQTNGWLNRYLATHSGGSGLTGVGFGYRMPFSLRGKVMVPLVDRLDATLGGPGQYAAELRRNLESSLSQTKGGSRPNLGLVQAAARSGLDQMAALNRLKPGSYKPANGEKYRNTDFGRALSNIAQVTKAGMGLKVATVDIGGWDTHSGQGAGEGSGRQAKLLGEMASGISALYTDLSAHRQEVVILVMTEFGRTVKQNASGGTDHGHAAAWFALGGNVKGGIHGDWPGLAQGQLSQGRYLDHSIDCRDVMGEVMKHHLGAASQLETILPGHNYRPVGFL